MSPWRYAINTVLSQTEKQEVTALANAGFTGKWMPFTARAYPVDLDLRAVGDPACGGRFVGGSAERQVCRA